MQTLLRGGNVYQSKIVCTATCITLQIEMVLGLRVWELKKTKQYIMIIFVNLK